MRVWQRVTLALAGSWLVTLCCAPIAHADIEVGPTRTVLPANKTGTVLVGNPGTVGEWVVVPDQPDLFILPHAGVRQRQSPTGGFEFYIKPRSQEAVTFRWAGFSAAPVAYNVCFQTLPSRPGSTGVSVVGVVCSRVVTNAKLYVQQHPAEFGHTNASWWPSMPPLWLIGLVGGGLAVLLTITAWWKRRRERRKFRKLNRWQRQQLTDRRSTW